MSRRGLLRLLRLLVKCVPRLDFVRGNGTHELVLVLRER